MKSVRKIWSKLLLGLILTQSAYAVDNNEDGVTSTDSSSTDPLGVRDTHQLPNPLGENSIGGIISSVTRFIIGVSTALLTVFVLYGAFQLMTSGGSPERIEKGRKTILWAVLGFAILLVAGGVGAIVIEILGGPDTALENVDTGDSPVTSFGGIIGVLDTAANWMFGILIALGTVMVLYSAFLYLFSGGSEDRISAARKTLTYAIVALVIAVLAGGVGVLIQNFVGGTTNTSCVVSDWGEWGPCNINGEQFRYREIITPSDGSGDTCPSLQQKRSCPT